MKPNQSDKQRNLQLHKTRFYPHQIDHFEGLKEKGVNVSHYIRQAVEEKISKEGK